MSVVEILASEGNVSELTLGIGESMVMGCVASADVDSVHFILAGMACTGFM